jgi:thymidylate synthase (FAD)
MEVTYLDHMSSDLGVVNAARVSFKKFSKMFNDKDEGLINYLAREGHWLPFRHPHVSFHCKAPLFVARQAGKHQVGMSWSEVSRRYVDDEPEFFTPEVWRKRADDKKQGSSDEVVEDPYFPWVDYGSAGDYNKYIEVCLGGYKGLLEQGVAPEQARMVLPQSMYTEWHWTGSLLAWAHFIKLRTEGSAQKEIQDFAKMFVPTFEELYPTSWKALMEHL